MRRPQRGSDDARDSDLLTLGRELSRLRQRCRSLSRDNWEVWSAAIEQTNALAHLIGRVQPKSLADLVVRYDALHWLMLEADDVIMDTETQRQFIGFGRALTQMISRGRPMTKPGRERP